MGGLFGQKAPQAQKQQPAGALNVQTSVYGAVKPLAYGKNRLPVNLIHYVNFTPVAHTEKQKTGGKGGSKSTSNTTYTYTVAFAAGFAIGGDDVGVATIWKNKEKHTADSLGITVFSGAEGQVAWSYLTTAYPTQARPYANLAYIAHPAFDLGDSPSLPNLNVEYLGLQRYDAGVNDDALASDVVVDYLTNARHGAGFSYLADLDDGNASFRKYCLARGLFISPFENNQRQAGAFIADIAEMCNAGIVDRSGMLNLIPYGDSEITGNGATYTPDLTPLYDLTVDDFMFEHGQPPVKHSAKSDEQRYNHHRIEFNARANDYNPLIVEVKDQADIDDNGLRTKAVKQYKSITLESVARDVLQLQQQRDLHVVNKYSFRLGVRYSLLEGVDLVTLTEPGLGLDRQLVRITSVVELDDAVDIEAEEMNVGVANAPLYDTQGPQGYNQDYNASPGSVADPLIMNAPGMLTDSGFEQWIAIAGLDPIWGGCVVWIGDDDITYRRVGEVFGAARYGSLPSELAAGSADYDAASTLTAQLYRGQMISGSQTDVDEFRTLLYVGGEWMSYRDAELVSDTTYDINVLNRAAYGSIRQAHEIGSAFALIDEAIFRMPYDRGNIGKQVYFKFQSFNVFGGGIQDLADCTPWTHTMGGSELTAPLIGPNTTVELFSVGGVLTINCAIAEHFKVKLIEDCTVEFIHVPLNYIWILDVEQGGTYNLTFPASVTPVAPVGIPYSATQQVGAVDVLGGITDNVGITWQLRYSLYVDPTVGGNSNSGSGATFKVTVSPNPAHDYAASNPSIAVTATPENGTTPYTYLWERAPGGIGDWASSTGNTGGGDFTISSTTVANPTFSRTGTVDGYVAQNWRCTVTDGAGKSIQTILEIALEDDGEYPGTGGGWRCVSLFAWVVSRRGVIRARDVVVGDWLRCVDPLTLDETWEEVTYSERARQPGLTWQTATGVKLTCSTTAPLPLMDGGQIEAQHIFHQRTLVQVEGKWKWSMVIENVPIGDIWVQHITCKNKYFLAGDVKGMYAAHHNIKNIPELDPNQPYGGGGF